MLAEHVTLKVEGITEMYLNVYVPQLQRGSGSSQFLSPPSRVLLSRQIPSPYIPASMKEIRVAEEDHIVPRLKMQYRARERSV